jgi:hypothetical protein
MTGPEVQPRAASDVASRLFDLRGIIALLFAIYGGVLVIMGFTSTSDADIERAGGINLNLWSGVGMLVVAALFAAWVILRPLKLPTPADLENAPPDGPPAH